MTHLAVLDTTYSDIALESEAAARWSISTQDRRADRSTDHDADGILVQYATIDGAYLDRHPNVKAVGRYGVGVDTIDVEAASARGVAVFNVPDYCVDEVATHAVALALTLTRRIRESERLVRADRWFDWNALPPIPDLSSLTVGLLGVGQIGARTATMISPFVSEVIGYDPAGAPQGIEAVDFDTLLQRADILSLHCPLIPATQHVINSDTLKRMQAGAFLVNVSRGGLVDSTALSDALASGHLRGAAIDVVDEEPPAPTDALLAAPNLIITNHIAWLSEGSEPRLRSALADRCASYLAGRPTHPPLNARALAERKKA